MKNLQSCKNISETYQHKQSWRLGWSQTLRCHSVLSCLDTCALLLQEIPCRISNSQLLCYVDDTDDTATSCPYLICQFPWVGLSSVNEEDERRYASQPQGGSAGCSMDILHRAPSVWLRDNLDMPLGTSGQQQSETSVKWLCALRVSAKLLSGQTLNFRYNAFVVTCLLWLTFIQSQLFSGLSVKNAVHCCVISPDK